MTSIALPTVGIRISTCVVVFHISFAQLFGMDDETTLTIERIEESVIAARQSIKSGHVVVRSSVAKDGGTYRNQEYVIYFEGEKKRVDLKDLYGHIESGRTRTLSDSTAWGEDAFRYFTTHTTPDGGKLISLIAPKDSSRASSERKPDVWMIGMYPTAFANLTRYKLNSRIGDRIGILSLEHEDVEGDEYPLSLITYNEKWGRDLVWISPEQGFNVTRIERFGNAGEMKLRLVVELAKVDEFGWFPRRTEFTKFKDENTEMSESCDIEVVQFNRPIAADTWRFRKMGAPLGHRIHNFANSDVLLLDEDGVSLSDQSQPLPVASDISSKPSNAWKSTFLYLNGIICLVLGLALMLRYFAKRA